MAKTRIMFIENKTESLNGDARIGKVTFSQTGRSVHYNRQTFLKVKGYKYNHVDVESLEQYWISGCKKDGNDRLYGGTKPVHIDEDIREEYWCVIRELPQFKSEVSHY
ncbi:1-deoxy-D-xylulose-5-phosphate synthase [Mucilaginibacter psychrotolerans]|uniref:1-deoxy-D-xylulose-5-phosphate synthase n=1 Tax=Mucilaginibacter psychrotolerans TaxID=1524096 RepID=A0A4Y8SDU1_9SPHI|nr:1-deoxy-D-xylulose-5-phosphate synthase [Mucilaginibacter psychrotolerans]TFF36760.1 1-deoxy-D-xylulose-5-phosphate synthase [Mucilaginibacter psychrotolerans]